MIDQITYTPEWINSFKQQRKYNTVNPALFEKMIYAFSLLELLANSGLNFIFKGGSALLLLPVESNRFSIDIDITISSGKKELEEVLKKMIIGSSFRKYSENIGRAKSGSIPKAHYIFEFIPSANKIGNILLDVLFEENPYNSIEMYAIKNSWIKTIEPYSLVRIPSINSILGDKLTAFAPTTIGVPYWIGNPDKPDKRIEIIKQLHDVSLLIDHCSDIQETKVVFNAIAKNQIAYQCLDVNIEDVVQDIFDTALIIAKRDRNAEGFMLSRFAEIQSGLLMFKGYLISGNFRIEEAIIASAKTAFFIEQMQQNSPSFENFNLNINMDTWSIISPLYNFLNRLKKTNRQAFYYWYKCLELKNLLK